MKDNMNTADIPTSVVTAPGNHDCNFEKNTTVRDAVITSLKGSQAPAIDDDIISQCVSIQQEYFEFRDGIAAKCLIDKDYLWSQYYFEISGRTILFDSINVAWVSSKTEQIGSLLFPYEKYASKWDKPADIRVVVLHHPFHWLKQDRYRSMRSRVHSSGDLVLTGHEHSESASAIDSASTGESLLIEAGALQLTGDQSQSVFNVIEIDLEDSCFRYTVFELIHDKYQKVESEESWASYKALPKHTSNQLEISKEMCDWLNDVGANYSHPSKPVLKLGDVFLYPDVDDVNNEDGEGQHIVTSGILRDVSLLSRGALVTGQEKSGKTALLRTLFLEYYDQGLAPLFVDAKDLLSVSDKYLHTKILSNVERQYGKRGVENWNNLPVAKKVLLLDDYDRSRAADRYRCRIIGFFRARFERMIITASDILDIREVTTPELAAQMVGLGRYNIQSFGHKLRYQLIKKWRNIGDDYSLSSAELSSRVDSAEKILNAVLGKNLVPRVPIYLLTLLQSLESVNPTDIRNAAFGHYYHFLISDALNKVRVDLGKWDEFFNYLSQLSWLYYCSSKQELEYRDIEQFNQTYSREYTRVDCLGRLRTLVDARLIDKRGEYYSFSYPYVFFYFLGKYISEHIYSDPEIRALISRSAKHAYTRENAQILLFTIHHQKNDFVIDSLLDNIRGLFSEVEPVTFGKDTDAFNDLIEDTVHLVYKDSDPDEQRLADREYRDRIERDGDEKDCEEIDDDAVLDLPSKLNKLFKTVEILGQLLKSYYGSIRNERKEVILNDVYSAPLRALREFLTVVEENREPLIEGVGRFIKSKDGTLDKKEQEKLARKYVFNFVSMIAFGCVYKSASATSSAELQDVAAIVVQKNNSLAYRLTRLASRLDMPVSLPFEDIEALSRDTKKNIFAHRLLDTIVLRHLYFFDVPEQDKQRICSALGITMQYQRAIDVKSRKRKLQ